VYVTGVETVEFDNVVVEAFRTALEAEEDGGETSALKGLSFENDFAREMEGYMSIVRCCSWLKSVPAI
jgi:hypothetical protein